MKIVRYFLFLSGFLLGWAGSNAQETINIGFLIPDRHTLAARDGAELAITEANRQGGYSGKKFRLIVRSVEGPWGTGSKVAVSMIFDDEVVAIAASLDGRNAHLAEQITTKTKVAFVSTWSTDMTLSYAFVPWYFRCIPDDKQQAEAIIKEIGKQKITLIGEDTYDSRNTLTTFIKVAETTGIPRPQQIIIPPASSGKAEVLTDLIRPETEVYVLCGTPPLASVFMQVYRQKKLKQPVFGTISLLDDRKDHSPDYRDPEGIIIVSSDQWFSRKGAAFTKAFREAYGYDPGPAAAYAYDGMGVIIEAVRKTGTNRNRIIGYLSGIRYQGVTGEIRFDDKGNRSGTEELMIIKNHKPEPCRMIR